MYNGYIILKSNEEIVAEDLFYYIKCVVLFV